MNPESLVKELATLFESQHRQLFVAAISITRRRDSAEDAIHDALVSIAALKTRPKDLEAYLFRTVRNKAIYSLKVDKRFVSNICASDFLEFVDCSEDLKILATQVNHHLETLNLDSRQVIIMKIFGDLTFDEISKIMAISPNTIASLYRRGISKLKEKLNESDGE